MSVSGGRVLRVVLYSRGKQTKTQESSEAITACIEGFLT